VQLPRIQIIIDQRLISSAAPLNMHIRLHAITNYVHALELY